VPQVAWVVRSDRTLRQFLNHHREYIDQGYRLVDYESYETATGTRYAGAWAENDARYRLAGREALDSTMDA
jgi:hypothetical protein